jgi:hypothetical protein
MLQLVEDDGAAFPLASHAITNCTYVDDIVTGADSIAEAKNLIAELTTLFRQGGFELRKWSSNKPAAVKTVPTDHLENPLIFSDEDSSLKILGMKWMPNADNFSYNVVGYNAPCTKRNILSYAACTYDPLGMLTPVIFWIKHFLQRLWLEKLDWDEPLNGPLLKEWTQFSARLMDLQSIQIPRQVGNKASHLRLLGFADASEKGFAACVYLHATFPDGSVQVNLVRAKSKVAPTKTTTIPRLELSGALMLARLASDTQEILHSHTVQSARLHTDAKTVLGWLSTATYKLKIYVANRVTQILELSQPADWYYISTHDNPADVASRGSLPQDLQDHELWWHGPPSYHVPFEQWPARKLIKHEEEVAELKPVQTVLAVTTIDSTDEYTARIERWSSYQKAIRVTGWVLRFIHRCRRRQTPSTIHFSTKEIALAKELCIQRTQAH